MHTRSLVSAEAPVHSARLLDATAQQQLVELDARIAGVRPSAGQKTLGVVGLIGVGIAAAPLAASMVGMVVGIVVGAVTHGAFGARVGIVGAIPPVAWGALVVVGLLGGGALLVEHVLVQAQRREVSTLRAQRHALAARLEQQAAMATLTTF